MFITIDLRRKFGDSNELDADLLLEEVNFIKTDLYAKAREELFDVLYEERLDLAKLET